MSTRREDDSRPNGNVTSQRTTARDVPMAKYKDVAVGTVPPRGLRGPSLLPGQGAPERVVPEEVELAVLRDAVTLDGQNVARATAKRQPDVSSSPSPIPVSVEVPRARSVPPFDELASTPPSPSGRSIQSGTLMSVGSIDPRAPTERSLPSPRPLSVSERAAYFGPESVVDRSPSSVSSASERQSQSATESNRLPPVGVRASSPSFEPQPSSSQRSVPVSSARPALGPESVSPPAQNFARVPRSYSPVSPRRPAQVPARPAGSDFASPGPLSTPEVVPPFQIHAELDALPHELLEDSFDLRSAHTQREPLASRKPQPSSDWVTVHTPESAAHAPRSRPLRSSTSAVTLPVDRGRESTPPNSEPPSLRRAAVPLSWLLAAAVGVLIALLAVWILRATTARDSASPPRDRGAASVPGSAPLFAPASPPGLASVAQPAAQVVSSSPLPAAVVPRPIAPRPSAPPGASRAEAPFANSAAAPSPQPLPAPDASSKAHQSIY